SPFRYCSTISTFFTASILLFLDIKYPQVGFYIFVSYLRVSYHFSESGWAYYILESMVHYCILTGISATTGIMPGEDGSAYI
ncbi:hypothetical protein, partial [Mediterraneibacter gnavus]|uniref:hypothetical protein n=1 Tax=Mediterraneibacter gnavus TaxID=33038 RepID=UPI002557867C